MLVQWMVNGTVGATGHHVTPTRYVNVVKELKSEPARVISLHKLMEGSLVWEVGDN